MTALVIYGPINLRAETLLECVVQMCAQRHAIQDSPDGGPITQPDGCTKINQGQLRWFSATTRMMTAQI